MSVAATEPRTRISIEADSVHVIVNRFAQTRREEVVIASGWIVERDIVLRERDRRSLAQANAEQLGLLTDRAMRGRGEAMPERRLDAALGEQLAHAFE